MNFTSKTGRRGEEEACSFLKKKGYRIIERNVRFVFGELDIVAKDKNGLLVFVEVKTLGGLFFDSAKELQPEDHMTVSKIKRFRRAAEAYANAHSALITEQGYRLDLISICLGDTKKIIHYENIC